VSFLSKTVQKWLKIGKKCQKSEKIDASILENLKKEIEP